ncbi:MAG TPA: glycoside hydrolase family 19 protein [Burkholderiales bacterium]|nr:glycoside hydrolase family 19 protein [Burkholderiales bacterium]
MTGDQLLEIMPGAGQRIALFVQPLNAAMEEFEISTAQRQAAFIAQIAHESGQLVWLREIWGPTKIQRTYEPPSEKAAKLGNTQPGDGYRYRGRGLIQITGRANYRACGAALGVDLEKDPDQLAMPDLACRSAAWFWKSHGLNELADAGDFKTITIRINGGLTGETDRLAFYSRAQETLA